MFPIYEILITNTIFILHLKGFKFRVEIICKKAARRSVGKRDDRLLGGVPREQKMLKGHLPRVIYQKVY